ncbi:hypothetical protein PUN28_009149 [Cardiocondyla obscurior]|uniref:Uncharacterized protein n=1 Tax=Cardiocondyla obscurior TaxID=286306 RepID=A0AAW2FR71_9HYME
MTDFGAPRYTNTSADITAVFTARTHQHKSNLSFPSYRLFPATKEKRRNFGRWLARNALQPCDAAPRTLARVRNQPTRICSRYRGGGTVGARSRPRYRRAGFPINIQLIKHLETLSII